LKELGPDVSQIRHQAFEQAAQQINERVQKLDSNILQAAETFALIQQLVPNIEEPSDLYIDPQSQYFNPEYYKQQKEAIANVRQMMDDAKGKLQVLYESRQKETAVQRQMDAQKHWAMLLDADPTWKSLSEPQAVKRLDDLRSGVQQTYGLPAEVINGIYDNGFIRMAQDALAYRKASAKPLEAKAKQPARLVKTGSKRKAADSEASARKRAANKALKQTGKVTNLEDVWGDFI
jgi:exonuclease VII small subunit